MAWYSVFLFYNKERGCKINNSISYHQPQIFFIGGGPILDVCLWWFDLWSLMGVWKWKENLITSHHVGILILWNVLEPCVGHHWEVTGGGEDWQADKGWIDDNYDGPME